MDDKVLLEKPEVIFQKITDETRLKQLQIAEIWLKKLFEYFGEPNPECMCPICEFQISYNNTIEEISHE